MTMSKMRARCGAVEAPVLGRSNGHLAMTLAALAAMGLTACSDASPDTERSTRGLAGDGLVISAVYGGGGLSGATYTHDFVELFNRSADPVPLAGLSIQYGSATGTFGSFSANVVPLTTTATVPPGGYFLVQLAANSAGNGSPLPAAADQIATADLSGTNGKVAPRPRHDGPRLRRGDEPLSADGPRRHDGLRHGDRLRGHGCGASAELLARRGPPR
jgi:hypothetical protein